ncbi:MAG: EscU/YscU/HrcU family type III secretion system export apparatus switch protein [Deltaproteobacteria bacterium]|nr:EscU/YscU/HrcU family type III secretion system export apparatus switch protein [Deltaproteobacteria bacterium]
MSDRPGGDPDQQPTEKRLKKAWEQGETAWSSKVVIFLQMMVLVIWGTSFINSGWKITSVIAINSFSGKIKTSQALIAVYDNVLDVFIPIGFALAVTVLVSGFLQLGFRFNIHQLKPKLERLSISRGLKNMFSMKKLVDMLVSLGYTLAVSVAFFITISSNRDVLYSLPHIRSFNNLTVIAAIVQSFCIKVIVITIIFALLDYYLAWKKHNKNLLMTRVEVEKEMKQSEGDPMIKNSRRQMYAEIIESAKEDIREAKIVIVNPTKIAVALSGFDESVPKIIARGENLEAEKIRKHAARYGIPVYRDVKLARTLNEIPEGNEIPSQLFESIAIIMATLEHYGE